MTKAPVCCGGMVSLVAVLLAVTWFMLAPQRPPAAHADEAAKAAVKWEYCELVNNDKGHCSYSTAKEAVGANTWKEMADKLKVPQKDGEKVGNARLLVFNHLGRQGWELVSHGVMVINPGYGETFLFKRRVEK